LVKAALFICAGALLQELGTLDEIEAMPYSIRSYATMVVYMVAALALLGLPPFVTAGGKELIERSFSGPSAVLVSAVIMFSAAVSGAAVLRAGGRIFFGWGSISEAEASSPTEKRTQRESPGEQREVPWVMIAPAVVLLGLALALGLVSRLSTCAFDASAAFENREGYAAAVLNGSYPVTPRSSEPPSQSPFFSFATVALGIAIALLQLFVTPPRWVRSVTSRISDWAHQVHSGQIGDYVTWMIVATSVLGLVTALNLGVRISP
jgi:multicomponent Na+:H+ antiporter subunit D